MSFESIPELLTMLLQEQRNTNEQICRLAEVLAGVRSATVDTQAVITKAKAPKPAAEPAASAAPASAPVVPPAAEPVVEASVPSYSDTAALVTKLSQTKGRDVALAMLQTFGVDRLPLLDPKHFAAVIVAATTALEA